MGRSDMILNHFSYIVNLSNGRFGTVMGHEKRVDVYRSIQVNIQWFGKRSLYCSKHKFVV